MAFLLRAGPSLCVQPLRFCKRCQQDEVATVVPLPSHPVVAAKFLLSNPKSKRLKHSEIGNKVYINKDEGTPPDSARSWSAKPGFLMAATLFSGFDLHHSVAIALEINDNITCISSHVLHSVPLADLDPSVASVAIRILGPVFASLNFLFIIRIVMSWYPQLPVDKFPYVIAFAPTEPVLGPTRKLIPPVGGVDVSPVVWVALMSFLNEILLGQQGLLVLLSQQQM